MMKNYIIIIILLLLPICNLLAQDAKTIHVLVALCDNKYQGIVKVPKGIGNGQDPNTNLYWGCGYGVRTYFRKSTDWKEVKCYKSDRIRLERIVFKHKTKNYYLIADAYDGRNIKDCTIDLLRACSGAKKDSIIIDNEKIGLFGKAEVIAYVGHNGLMDFHYTVKQKMQTG